MSMMYQVDHLGVLKFGDYPFVASEDITGKREGYKKYPPPLPVATVLPVSRGLKFMQVDMCTVQQPIKRPFQSEYRSSS